MLYCRLNTSLKFGWYSVLKERCAKASSKSGVFDAVHETLEAIKT